MDQSKAILNDIELLMAHYDESTKIVARIKRKLQPVSTGRSKNKKGLSATFQANLIARKRKHQKIKTA